MPVLGSNEASLPIKMLVIAYSGFGKTGALASLAKTGYKLHILDMDNGTEILLDETILPAQFRENIEVETFTDKFKVIGDKAVPISALAWTKAMQCLDKWTTKYTDSNHVIVVDSLTFLCEAAMRHVLSTNKRLSMHPYQSDWGDAQRLIENALAMLYVPDVKANVIVNSHIGYYGGPDPNAQDKKDDDDKPTVNTVQPIRGLPTTVGKALSPKVPRYFNNMIVGKTMGEGPNAPRHFYTSPIDLIDAKVSKPKALKSQYPIGNGLAEIFAALRPKTTSA